MKRRTLNRSSLVMMGVLVAVLGSPLAGATGVNTHMFTSRNSNSTLDSRAIRKQIRISNATLVKPDPRVVKIIIRTPHKMKHECSGAVISRNKVLTAAHCVRDGGEWVEGKYSVQPGVRGNRLRWGEFRVARQCIHGHNPDTGENDIAILTIRPNERGKSIGDVTGWYGLSNHRNGRYVRAYAGGLSRQHHEFCNRAYYNDRVVRHDCFLVKGTSGSPVYAYDSETDKRWIVAVNSHKKGGWNYAIRLRDELWDFVKGHVDSDF